MAHSLFYSFHSYHDIWQYSSANPTERTKNDGLQQHSSSWVHFGRLYGSNKRGRSSNRCSRDSPSPNHVCFSYFRKFRCVILKSQKGIQTDLNGSSGLWEKNARLIHWRDNSSSQLDWYATVAGILDKFVYLFISPIQIAPWLTLIAIVNTGISVG